MGKTTNMNLEGESQLQWAKISGEVFREYVFANGKVRIENVTELCIRPSGNHRLNTADGRKFVIPVGWLAIEVGAAEWSV